MKETAITRACNNVATPRAALSSWIVTAITIVAAPLIGLWIGGAEIRRYMEFPPKTLHVIHAPFSPLWWAFYAVATSLLVVLSCRTVKVATRISKKPGRLTLLSLTFLSMSWMIAWNRWEWAAFIQPHTFLLLWLSYICFMNALLWETKGNCPVVAQPRAYLLSFPMSALFWWSFEFLNRFTQNWYYIEVERYTPTFYTFLATLSFATVLPSIWVTKTFLEEALLVAKGPGMKWTLNKGRGLILVCFATLILSLLPFFPDYLFGAIWVAPLALILGLRAWRGGVTVLGGGLAMWALAGLWCGFLWELWNLLSAAKWIYLIPFVQRYYLFEMPLVGYGGYLPFGILCGLIIESLQGGQDE